LWQRSLSPAPDLDEYRAAVDLNWTALVIGALLQTGLPVMFLVALCFFRSPLGLAPFRRATASPVALQLRTPKRVREKKMPENFLQPLFLNAR